MDVSPDFETKLPYLKDLPNFLELLNVETDRGAALVVGAMLDDALADCIKKRLVEHPEVAKLVDGFNAPFGTLSARILGCLGLGIISESEYKNLTLIRKIRNEFAHHVHISFDTEKVASMCRSLQGGVQEYDARANFTTCAVALIVFLLYRAAHATSRLECWTPSFAVDFSMWDDDVDPD